MMISCYQYHGSSGAIGMSTDFLMAIIVQSLSDSVQVLLQKSIDQFQWFLRSYLKKSHIQF